MILKGIVSRDFGGVFFGIILYIWSSYTSGAGIFAFIILFSCRISRSELTLWVELSFCHIAPYWEPCNTELMEMLFWLKNFEDGNCPSPGSGLFAAPYIELPEFSLISCVKPIEKYLANEPRTGTKSQVYSKLKLTKLRCEIDWKIRHENEI
jgi:hypothetical protein